MTRLGGSAELKLTWHEPRRTWKKKLRGRSYYFPGKCNGKTDATAYAAALAWWEGKRLELDRAHTEQNRVGEGVFGDLLPGELKAIEEAESLRHQYEQAHEGAVRPPSFESWRSTQETLARATSAEAVEVSQTVRAYAERIVLAKKRGQALAGQRSGGRYANLRSYLLGKHGFVAFVGPDKDAKLVNWDGVLESYHAQLLGKIGRGEMSRDAAGDKMQCAKQFVNRLWQNGAIELPRNIGSPDLEIVRGNRKIDLPPFEVYRAVLLECPETFRGYPLKAWVMLAAACGMTQVDVSDLRPEEVDFKAGTIKRKRSKTAGEENVPEVTFYLWKELLDLLRRHGSFDGERVFSNSAGEPLVEDKINPDSGGTSSTDRIGALFTDWFEQSEARSLDAFAAWEKRVNARKIKRRTSLTFGIYRHGSRTRFEEHPEFRTYGSYWLGQSARGVDRRHYAQPSEESFKAMCGWLRGEYFGHAKPKAEGKGKSGDGT